MLVKCYCEFKRFQLWHAGDDCISIQTGCSNVYVHNVNCGPGHGISIGSLGKDNTRACVSNITVRDVNIHDSMNGVRIKTWQVNAFNTMVTILILKWLDTAMALLAIITHPIHVLFWVYLRLEGV